MSIEINPLLDENLNIDDLIDIPEIQSVVDEFNKITNIAMAIGNNKGELLVKTGFQDICNNFHRSNQISCKNCNQSDTTLFRSAFSGEYMQYKCLNNMWDISTPIIIDGKIIGAIYLGQFIYEDDEIDYEVFKNQAKLYGYDEKEYLTALDQVPRVSHKFIDNVMNFYIKFANIVALLSYKNINIQKVKTEQEALILSLKESEKRFATTINNIPDAILVYDRNCKILYANNSMHEIFGKDEAPSYLEALKNALKTKKRQSIDLEIEDLENSNRNMIITFIPIIENGAEIEILVIMHDYSEQKKAQLEIEKLNVELEQKVEARTKQLLEANKELDTFTYSVSHDLKAPLRGIDGYSKLLLEEFDDQLNQDGKFYLGTIRQSVTKMNQLIEDLLNFSRIERKPFQYGKVDLQKLVNDLISELGEEFLAGGGVIHSEIPNIYLKTSPEGLSMAMKNLIENALKYSPEISQAIIEIRAEEREDTLLITVKDNGIGFDMKYHDRIFNIFERLHRAEDYPGTGIGLAMVKKIAERLHGRAWATSIPGKGSSFYFEISKEITKEV